VVPLFLSPPTDGDMQLFRSNQSICHDTLDFVSTLGYPSAIHLFALTHSRRIVSRHLPSALDRCPNGFAGHVVRPTHSIVFQR
jgi:hypothetical protein